MVRSFTKYNNYVFKGKDGIEKSGKWIDVHKWVGETAILVLQDLKDESVKYLVPDNLIMKEL